MKLKYLFEPRMLEGRMAIHVVLDIAARKPGDIQLVLPSSWGNAADLYRAVSNLRVMTDGAMIIDASDPDKKVLRSPTSAVRVSYDLIKDWDGPLRESVRHRAHMEPTYLEINTNNALVHPDLKQTAPVDCRFDWKLPVGWSLATSFGSETRQQFRGSWDDIQNAVFVAGDFRIAPIKLDKRQLLIAIRGKLSASDEEIASQISTLIQIEREFWQDNAFPYYLVTVVPYGAGNSGSGGGGFTNAFSLHLAEKDSLSKGALSLMTHEVFHAWNPYRLGRMPNPPENIYWFTEGFTTYYQDLLLLRAGLLSFEEYIQAVNRVLRNYSLSPAKNASLKELIDRSRNGSAKSRISYERGAAIALWLDWRIRSNTSGKLSLDSLMLDLLREAKRRKEHFLELTAERVFHAAVRYISSKDVEQLRSYVEMGTTVEVPQTPFGSCVAREFVDIPSFELGMSQSDLVKNHKIKALKPGSNAQKSGLQEDDTIIGTSIYWNDTSKPVKLAVRRAESTLRVEYYPRGASLGVTPQYILDQTRFQANPRACQSRDGQSDVTMSVTPDKNWPRMRSGPESLQPARK